ncbi:MAG: STAS domain-containing protein [Pirellulaceae bacterium]
MSENTDTGIRYLDGVMIIEPPSELLDRLEISNVGDSWLEAIQAERPKRVVISFDGVSFFGSEAIGLILRIAKRVREYGGEVKLCSMGKMVREIFEVCHLVPTLFQVYDSTADAIASF